MISWLGKAGDPCENCHERPATIQWVGEGGTAALVHGWYRWWCEPCCVQAQIDYAEKATARLPELRATLAKLPTAATTAPFIDLAPDEPSGMFRCDHGTVFDRGESGWELISDAGCPCFATEG